MPGYFIPIERAAGLLIVEEKGQPSVEWFDPDQDGDGRFPPVELLDLNDIVIWAIKNGYLDWAERKRRE